jgi:hypothetical protein
VHLTTFSRRLGRNGPRRVRLASLLGIVAAALVFAATASATGPSNDMFGARQTVSGGSGTATGSNVGATKESGEPNHAGNPGGASVWYSWTPPAAGTITISTFGSGYDTLLGVYTGSSVGSLTSVASNDDAIPTAGWSSVTFPAAAGTVYQIAVDGYNGGAGPSMGDVTLDWNWNPSSPVPANDNFSNGQTITGFCSSTTGTNLAATKEPGEPNHAGNVGGASVWYVWTAPFSSQATVTTAGSDFDTLLGVYTGSSVGSLTLVASNDDVSGSNQTSSVTFNAVAGTTYRIAVDGYNGPSHGLHEGHIVLNWCQTLPPPKCNQKVNTRWHYRSHGTSGSWSATTSPNCQTGSISIGPSTMEGDLKVSPGQSVDVGYDFSLPGNHSAFTVLVNNPQVVFTIRCVSGRTPSQSSYTVTMPTQLYSVSDSDWHPSGDQQSSLVWEGTFTMPNLCNGGQVRLDKGGTFTANILLF